MKKFKFSKRSKKSLKGVHPSLVNVMTLALGLSEVDFIVTEGVRSEGRQRKLLKAGKAQTMESKHLTGHAVDVAAYVKGKVSWKWKHYYKIAEAVAEASNRLGVSTTWVGSRTFKDGGHFQLTYRL